MTKSEYATNDKKCVIMVICNEGPIQFPFRINVCLRHSCFGFPHNRLGNLVASVDKIEFPKETMISIVPSVRRNIDKDCVLNIWQSCVNVLLFTLIWILHHIMIIGHKHCIQVRDAKGLPRACVSQQNSFIAVHTLCTLLDRICWLNKSTLKITKVLYASRSLHGPINIYFSCKNCPAR